MVALDRAARCPAELFAMKVGGRRAVRRVGRQPLQALEVEEAAVKIVRARLGDHVDDAAGGAAEFRVGPTRHDLKLLHRLQRDVDRRALTAELLAEEPVVVVAAIEADVVVHASLAVEGDLVAVRSLDDAHAGSEGEEILELAAEDRCRADGRFVERVAHLRSGHIDERGAAHRDRLCGARDLQHGIDGDRLTDREDDVLLHVSRETRQTDRHDIRARAGVGERRSGRQRRCVSERRTLVAVFLISTAAPGTTAPVGVSHRALDDARRNLRLTRSGYGEDQTNPKDQRDLSRHGCPPAAGRPVSGCVTEPGGPGLSYAYTRSRATTQARKGLARSTTTRLRLPGPPPSAGAPRG